MTLILSLLLAANVVVAEPLHIFEFDSAGALSAWNHKSNTRLQVIDRQPQSGDGAVRMLVDPTEYSYGWMHTEMPELDYTTVGGIHGYYRAESGVWGRLVSHLCLAGQDDGRSYFQTEFGQLRFSGGRWIEFYAGLQDFQYQRGAIKRLRPARLNPDDLLQFLASVGGEKPVAVDIDRVTMVSKDDAAKIAARCRRASRRRMLKPPKEACSRRHPRMFFDNAHRADYRAKANAGGASGAAFHRVVERAGDLLGHHDAAHPLKGIYDFVENSGAEGTSWRGSFEGKIVQASRPIELLAGAYQLTGDRRFADHGTKALVNAAKRLTVDEQFLDRGFYYSRTFYVRALAFGYDWLWHELTPDQRRTVQTTLLGFVNDIYEKSQTAGWGKQPLDRVWNWDPGLMGACGVGMLALEGETHLPEKSIVFACRRHLRDYLTLGIDADGCGHEGPSYLAYGIGVGVQFIEALRQQGRGDLFKTTNYDLIPPWLIAETLPEGRRWNNLSDCSHGMRPRSVYFYACKRLSELAKTDPAAPEERWTCPEISKPLRYLQQFSEQPGDKRISYESLSQLMGWHWERSMSRFDPAEFDGYMALAHVLLFEPCEAIHDPGQLLPLGLHFRGRGLVVSRTGFGANDIHLAVEAGPHAAGHDQSDKGTFTLYGYGGDLTIDSGYGNDGDPTGSTSSHAHNVVLIDRRGQPMRHHNQSSGHITGFNHNGVFDWIRVDAKDAWSVRYDHDLRPMPTTPVKRADRSFLFVRPSEEVPPYLIVYDDIVKDAEPHNYTWQWHIPPQRTFELGDRWWTTTVVSVADEMLTSQPEGPGGSASFKFIVDEGGEYAIYGLVRAGGPQAGKSDSFWVTVDGGKKLLWDLHTGHNFRLSRLQDRQDTQPPTFQFHAGEHTINIAIRERQSELARWLILPAGTEPPLDPTAEPEKGIAMGIDDAQISGSGLLRRPVQRDEEAAAALDVLPVHPQDGEIETNWFETSRQGAHPRLQYTARAAAPQFLMLLLPRTEGIPHPQVDSLNCQGGTGARIQWDEATDYVIFSRKQAAGERMALDGSCGFVRTKQNRPAAWGLMDGTRLSFDGNALHTSDQPVMEIHRGGQSNQAPE